MILCSPQGIMTAAEKDHDSRISHERKIVGGPLKPSVGLTGQFLHCRCLEHVNNLGAYTASRPETGLLPPSESVNNQLQSRL
jgi:hypothetical protein